MARKSIHKRHNLDGSVTTTTTYRRKNILGQSISETYVNKSYPEPKKNTVSKDAVILLIVGFLAVLILGGLAVSLAVADFSTPTVVAVPILIVLVVIIIAIIAYIKRKNTTNSVSDTWRCTKCDSINPISDNICQCGNHRPQAKKKKEPSYSDTWVCDECGTRNPIASRYCKNCSCEK